jgi:hypothetical protein
MNYLHTTYYEISTLGNYYMKISISLYPQMAPLFKQSASGIEQISVWGEKKAADRVVYKNTVELNFPYPKPCVRWRRN